MRLMSSDFKQSFEYVFRKIYFEFYFIDEITVLSKLLLKYIKRSDQYFNFSLKMLNFFKQKEYEEVNFQESIIFNTIIDCNNFIATIFTDLFLKIGIFKIFSFDINFIFNKECNCTDSNLHLNLKQSKDKRFWYYKCRIYYFYKVVINYSKRKSKIKSVKRKRVKF